MTDTVIHEIMDLQTRSLEELKSKYEALFGGQKANSNNKTYLWRKLAYRIQELNCGGHTNETHAQLSEIIEHYDPINNKSLRPDKTAEERAKRNLCRDKRLPIPGTVITKRYKDQILEIKVLDRGFEFKTKTYKTLSAIANELTRAHWNGYLFFGL